MVMSISIKWMYCSGGNWKEVVHGIATECHGYRLEEYSFAMAKNVRSCALVVRVLTTISGCLWNKALACVIRLPRSKLRARFVDDVH